MATWVRNLEADFADETTTDGNAKTVWDSAEKLAPLADAFGSATTGWTEKAGTDWWTSRSTGKGNSALQETGGEQLFSDAGNNACAIGSQFDTGFPVDFDIAYDVSDGVYAAGKGYGMYLGFGAIVGQGNYIQSCWYNRGAAPGGGYFFKCINNARTTLATVAWNSDSDCYFRIRRDAAGAGGGDNYFWAYVSSDGSSWTERYAGQIRDATHFNENDTLYPIWMIEYLDATTDVITPKITHFYQYTTDIAAQLFWSDNPECNIEDSGNSGEYYADMGAGNTFTGTSFAATVSESGAHIVNWKFGTGTTADRASATFDTEWRTTAALSTKVGDGDFNGTQYAFLKAQVVSDGTFQTAITDVTVTGSATASESGESMMMQNGIT